MTNRFKRSDIGHPAMSNLISTTVTKSLSAFFLIAMLVIPAVAGNPQALINKGPDDVAILGYDTVAYFTEGRAVKGNPGYAFSWQDAKWHFVNAKHRDLFAANPERYAPQFGGHCAMALTRGEVKVIDPEAWIVSEGKLYLSFSKKGINMYRQNTAAYIKESEDNWAKLPKQK